MQLLNSRPGFGLCSVNDPTYQTTITIGPALNPRYKLTSSPPRPPLCDNAIGSTHLLTSDDHTAVITQREEKRTKSDGTFLKGNTSFKLKEVNALCV